jgi:pimeloyl-ACP methyl ester carboxylesterase
MYQSARFPTILATALLSAATISSGAFGAETTKKMLTSSAEKFEAQSISQTSLAPIPPLKELRVKPEVAELYEYDTVPLGDRQPLLMVHGLHGEFHRNFRWSKVIQHVKRDRQLDKQFKIYFARYSTSDKLEKTVPELRNVISKLYALSGNRPITMMALSMGGNVAYEAFLDKDTEEKIKKFMAFGVPFHGSPLFSTDWLQYGVYKNICFPWTRIDHSLAYRVYFKRNAVLMTDLRWDNADTSVPEVGSFKSRLPFGPSGVLTVAGAENRRLLALNAQPANKKKIVAYGGYLLNPYLMPKAERFIESKIMAPYTFITLKVPSHFAAEHPVLKMLNREITTVVCSPSANAKTKTKYVYGLNDGITPLQSALCLPNSVVASVPLARESDVAGIKAHADVGTARVFRNIDHLTFIDGYKPLRGTKNLKDQLNPAEGTHTIFDWIGLDLKRSLEDQSKLATEAEAKPASTKTETD